MDQELPISFDALQNKVFRFAGRMVYDAEDARDIVHYTVGQFFLCPERLSAFLQQAPERCRS
ncbi:MAG: hypothetical protein EA393_14875 [Bacteroidetes bacterium]|nr:MAG: hypothetical protein EA393_14875 [Bacteroidota bacterium]